MKFTALLFFSISILTVQSQRIDSLKQLFHNEKDNTFRINLRFEIGKALAIEHVSYLD